MDDDVFEEHRAAPHVVMEGETFVCHNCRQRYRMNLPCPVLVFAAAANAFADGHRDCPAPVDALP